MSNSNDNIYAQPLGPTPFKFDKRVASVFPDMIQRSVPGYADVLHNIQLLATQYVQPDSNCYDLGCSLGAVCLAMSCGNKHLNVNVIGIDNSTAMIERCQNNIDNYKHATPIKLVNGDILQHQYQNASMVVLNYTLQFISLELREQLLANVFAGMLPGGILVISEKLHFEDPSVNQLIIDLHHQFKRENGYSDLEISQKRNALENVLIPETMQSHINRLKSAGFEKVHCWNQQLNFASFIAFKP